MARETGAGVGGTAVYLRPGERWHHAEGKPMRTVLAYARWIWSWRARRRFLRSPEAKRQALLTVCTKVEQAAKSLNPSLRIIVYGLGKRAQNECVTRRLSDACS